MPRRGIRELQSIELRIEQAIREIGEEFTPGQVAEKTGIRKSSVQEVLAKKAKRGVLEIVTNETVYRHGGRKLTHNLPSAFVAEKAWNVLTNAKQPLNVSEVAAEAETLAGNKNLDLLGSVATLMSNWYKNGNLERSGRGGKWDPFRYKIKNGVQERPVATR